MDPVQLFRIRPGQNVPDPIGSGSTTPAQTPALVRKTGTNREEILGQGRR
jgi:hypothetical protein